jgi:hypothetical protein
VTWLKSTATIRVLEPAFGYFSSPTWADVSGGYQPPSLFRPRLLRFSFTGINAAHMWIQHFALSNPDINPYYYLLCKFTSFLLSLCQSFFLFHHNYKLIPFLSIGFELPMLCFMFSASENAFLWASVEELRSCESVLRHQLFVGVHLAFTHHVFHMTSYMAI